MKNWATSCSWSICQWIEWPCLGRADCRDGGFFQSGIWTEVRYPNILIKRVFTWNWVFFTPSVSSEVSLGSLFLLIIWLDMFSSGTCTVFIQFILSQRVSRVSVEVWDLLPFFCLVTLANSSFTILNLAYIHSTSLQWAWWNRDISVYNEWQEPSWMGYILFRGFRQLLWSNSIGSLRTADSWNNLQFVWESACVGKATQMTNVKFFLVHLRQRDVGSERCDVKEPYST